MTDSKLDFVPKRTTTGAVRTAGGVDGTRYAPASKLDLPGTLDEFVQLDAAQGIEVGNIVGAAPFKARDKFQGVANTTPAALGTPPTGWVWEIERIIVAFDAAYANDVIVNVGPYILDAGSTSTPSTLYAVADENMPLLVEPGDQVTVEGVGGANTPFTVHIQYKAIPVG